MSAPEVAAPFQVRETAVVVLESQCSYYLQQRPPLDHIADPGLCQFIGGGVEPTDADRMAAALREIEEETTLPHDEWALGMHQIASNIRWIGRRGTKVRYFDVSVFRGILTPMMTEFELKEPGSIVRIPKNLPAIEANDARLARFPAFVLRKLVKGEAIDGIKHY